MPRVKSGEQPQPTEEPIENSVEVNEVEPLKNDEEIQKPKRAKREKSPAQIAAWDKLQIANKKKFEERKLAKERGEVVIPHGRNIDKQSKAVLEKLDKFNESLIDFNKAMNTPVLDEVSIIINGQKYKVI